jgi:hypothetical protein
MDSLNLVQELGQVIPVMEQSPPLLLDFEVELLTVDRVSVA